MRRLFDPTHWNADGLLVALAFVLTFALAACMNVDSDTWWLLRAGQTTLEQGAIVTTDWYSWTNYGNFWINHEWLTQVLMYSVFALGGVTLLVAMFASIVTATWAGVYNLSVGAPRFRALLVLLGVLNNAIGWNVRPQLISLGLFVFTLWLIPHKRWHWLYPPLFLLWVNLHAGFAAGGALLAIVTAVALIKFRAEFVHWLLISVGCALVTLLNPHGWHTWAYALNVLDHPARQLIQEWRPHSLTRVASYPFFGLIALTLWSLWRTRTMRRDVFEWTLVVAGMIFMVLALRTMRQTVFFDVLAVPLISRAFAQGSASKPAEPRQGRFNQVLIGFMFVGALGMIGLVWSRREAVLSPAMVTAVRSCAGNIYNTYDLGGELIWFVPEKLVFIDNRQDPYSDAFFMESAQVEFSGDYQDLFDRYPVTCGLMPQATPLAQALQRDGWQAKQQDRGLILLQKP